MRKIFTPLVIVVTLPTPAQSQAPTGRLTSTDGSPAPGVTIVERDTTSGSVAMPTGYFGWRCSLILRWLSALRLANLKRNQESTVDQLTGAVIPWNLPRLLFPIPFRETNASSNLKQNVGY